MIRAIPSPPSLNFYLPVQNGTRGEGKIIKRVAEDWTFLGVVMKHRRDDTSRLGRLDPSK